MLKKQGNQILELMWHKSHFCYLQLTLVASIVSKIEHWTLIVYCTFVLLQDSKSFCFFMQNLNHKNIVKYLGSLKTKSHLHIILE
jgi:hypothetical protein